MKTQDLLKIMRNELEITTCIQSLIFGKFTSMKELEEMQEKHKLDLQRQNENAANSSFVHSSDFQNNFSQPLHRIQVFNQIKKILLRMTRQNGKISLGLLDGLMSDLRIQMNVDIARFQVNDRSSKTSLGDFIFADKKKIIGVTAQIIQTYTQFDVLLPRSVQKSHKLVLRDFSLLFPLKVMEALDPEAFEKEEAELERIMIAEEKRLAKQTMYNLKKNMSAVVNGPKQRRRSYDNLLKPNPYSISKS